jgi:hypothetical protein
MLLFAEISDQGQAFESENWAVQSRQGACLTAFLAAARARRAFCFASTASSSAFAAAHSACACCSCARRSESSRRASSAESSVFKAFASPWLHHKRPSAACPITATCQLTICASTWIRAMPNQHFATAIVRLMRPNECVLGIVGICCTLPVL